ncbi:hypothetical protein T07_13659 [Trichinella nelsoni]|uniref:Uncharacterized protein n=1 Tax=Trichinella nelsoni TaxID=6336 RepID=A0A0V0S8D5_9BILA|nr:hypothetical protein T07_13659 [Trichinella nelsoni]
MIGDKARLKTNSKPFLHVSTHVQEKVGHSQIYDLAFISLAPLSQFVNELICIRASLDRCTLSSNGAAFFSNDNNCTYGNKTEIVIEPCWRFSITLRFKQSVDLFGRGGYVIKTKARHAGMSAECLSCLTSLDGSVTANGNCDQTKQYYRTGESSKDSCQCCSFVSVFQTARFNHQTIAVFHTLLTLQWFSANTFAGQIDHHIVTIFHRHAQIVHGIRSQIVHGISVHCWCYSTRVLVLLFLLLRSNWSVEYLKNGRI